MRDFRNAKAMAHTLRAALAAKGHRVTISQSLELIAEAFGAADWNSLSAAIRAETSASSNAASPAGPIVDSASAPGFSGELEASVRRALAYAKQRNQQFATLEHLLLALIDDAEASAVLSARGADLGALRADLTGYIDNELKGLAIDNGENPRPTVAFQRVIQRAAINAQELGRDAATGAQLLVAIFPERESRAAQSLEEQAVTRNNAMRFILHGASKASDGSADETPHRSAQADRRPG